MKISLNWKMADEEDDGNDEYSNVIWIIIFLWNNVPQKWFNNVIIFFSINYKINLNQARKYQVI